MNIPTACNTEAKFYDQIGWFMDESLTLRYALGLDDIQLGIPDPLGVVPD